MFGSSALQDQDLRSGLHFLISLNKMKTEKRSHAPKVVSPLHHFLKKIKQNECNFSDSTID